jgi:hypothetical protein
MKAVSDPNQGIVCDQNIDELRHAHNRKFPDKLDFFSVSRLKSGEPEDDLAERVGKTDQRIQDDGSFKRAIREQDNWGLCKGFNRPGQTLPKYLRVAKTSPLNEAFCLAGRGQKGWSSRMKAR